MKRLRIPALAITCVLAVICCLFSAPAVAQSPVSDPLSQGLDNGITGLESSNILILTDLFPGANNLTSPDEHVLVPDFTGTNIFSTTMSPAMFASPTIRPSTQLDTSLRDATIATGARTQTSTAPVVDFASGDQKPRTWGAAGMADAQHSSSAGGSALTSHASQGLSGKIGMADVKGTASSWKIGGSAPPLADSASPKDAEQAPQPFTVVGEAPPDDDSNAATPGTTTKKKRVGLSGLQKPETSDDASSPQEKTKDAPSSLVPTWLQGRGDPPDSPFSSAADLNNRTFLQPDLLSPFKGMDQKTTRTSSLLSKSTGLSKVSRSLTAKRKTGADENQDEDSLDARLFRSSKRLTNRSMQREKWHNPILRQMDDSTPRQ